MDSFNNVNESNYLEIIENKIFQCNTFSELSTVFKVKVHDLNKILKSSDIKLQSNISNYQKHLFFGYAKSFYAKYFSSNLPRAELRKQKRLRRSTKKNALNSLHSKQKILNALEQGFESNYLGFFEELRIERIEKLKNEIHLLKKACRRLNKKKSNYQKPSARIIYTPIGGKVK